MKILLLSDLHLEFADFTPDTTAVDVVVLAGDIAEKTKGVKWAMAEIDKPVIYVLGNHEYYRESYPKLVTKLKQLTQNSNVHVLENDSVQIDDVTFFGCTLWTDFNLFGTAKQSGHFCQLSMNDYRYIRRTATYSKMRSMDTALIHTKSLKWLEQDIEQCSTDKKIVVSHHAPSIQSLPRYKHNDDYSPAYASHLDAMIKTIKPNYWFHGHIHTSVDYQIDKTRVVCNPRGYAPNMNPSFDPSLIKVI